MKNKGFKRKSVSKLLIYSNNSNYQLLEPHKHLPIRREAKAELEANMPNVKQNSPLIPIYYLLEHYFFCFT